MQNFIDTEDFLYKYLTLELFEKLYRLKKYIDTCKKFDKKNNDDRIVQLFLNSIEIIGNEINELCSDITDDMSDTEKLAISIKISQNSKAIKKIHEELRNLHSSWILPEIKTFTNEIIAGDMHNKEGVYIILSDNYTFLERNLGKRFESSLKEVYSKSQTSDLLQENHSFVLPKIEFSNPLNWTIIVHEAGHLQKEIIEIIRNNNSIMPDNIQSLGRNIIKNWAEEIFCDVYAISVLGPAYFVSFVTFALLSSLDYGISSYSDLHPSVIVRASIMINFLKDNNLLFKGEWGLSDYTKKFYTCLINQSDIVNDKNQASIEGLTKFNSNLRKQIKELQLCKYSIDEADSKRINELLSNLQGGIPIGSVCIETSIEQKNLIKKDNPSIEEIEQLKNSVSERSCKIWEILNTGWIYKLQHSCSQGEKIFFDVQSQDNPIMDKINAYGKEIDFLDERLLSSINSSQIIKIIER